MLDHPWLFISHKSRMTLVLHSIWECIYVAAPPIGIVSYGQDARHLYCRRKLALLLQKLYLHMNLLV